MYIYTRTHPHHFLPGLLPLTCSPAPQQHALRARSTVRPRGLRGVHSAMCWWWHISRLSSQRTEHRPRTRTLGGLVPVNAHALEALHAWRHAGSNFVPPTCSCRAWSEPHLLSSRGPAKARRELRLEQAASQGVAFKESWTLQAAKGVARSLRPKDYSPCSIGHVGTSAFSQDEVFAQGSEVRLGGGGPFALETAAWTCSTPSQFTPSQHHPSAKPRKASQ